MKKMIITLAVIFCVGCVLCSLLYHTLDIKGFLSAAITLGTFAYHFVMRLAVGGVINAMFHNRMDYSRLWFRQRAFEPKLYKALGVKKWKSSMPTYDPDTFSPELHSYEEIVQSMCQAEVVHEVIALLSFVPLLFSLLWGDFAVFLITSVIAAAVDMMFVMMQRYNRPRLLRLMKHKSAKSE